MVSVTRDNENRNSTAATIEYLYNNIMYAGIIKKKKKGKKDIISPSFGLRLHINVYIYIIYIPIIYHDIYTVGIQ